MISILISIPFVLSALFKSLDSGFFIRQILRLGFIPSSVGGLFGVLILAMLWCIATSLFFGYCTGFIIPLAQLFLSFATLITILQAWKQKRPSCGCYGPGIIVPPSISILINMLLFFGLSTLPPSVCTHDSVRTLSIFVLVGVVLGRMSQSSPIIDFSPIALGKKWNTEEEHEWQVISFLSQECDVCHLWKPVLNALHKHHPVHIYTTTCDDNSVPCTSWSRKKILTSIESFPTIILLHNNTIIKKWTSPPPQNLLEQIQKAHYAT